MARSLRIEYPGAVYHITGRGNGGQSIFADDADREGFLECLGLAIARHGWRCHAYCLMGNHYHLLIETPEANLSQGMRHVNGVYTQRFNRAHGRAGHLFQGRFKAILVERESYLLEVARYIVLNPVRAGMVREARQWPWSSYGATAGDEGEGVGGAPDWLEVDWLRAQFGGHGAPSGARGGAREGYRKFVAEGVDDERSPLAQGLAKAVTAGAILGGEKFVAGLKARLANIGGEVPARQRHLDRPALAELHAGAAHSKDRAWMLTAQRQHGYSQNQIAAEAGLHYATVSRLIKALENPA